ncbi:hypothetical protein OIU77_029775 [Salix suchowensis]|uniref:Uncharacterized protein n=1 Tax=Salix suchowensis TaxID=1278906 RepID=A0ABQ9B9Q3_9ROSI|nr:hypothetical protein OIU77_029775 [Salix suchowensis]
MLHERHRITKTLTTLRAYLHWQLQDARLISALFMDLLHVFYQICDRGKPCTTLRTLLWPNSSTSIAAAWARTICCSLPCLADLITQFHHACFS